MPTIAQLLNPNRRRVAPRWPLHPPYTPKPGTDKLVTVDRGERPAWMNASVVDPAWMKHHCDSRWHIIVEGKPYVGKVPVLMWSTVHAESLRYAMGRLRDLEIKLRNGHWDAVMLKGRGKQRASPVAVHLVEAYNASAAKDAVRAGEAEATVHR
jgi:hypothetical protein